MNTTIMSVLVAVMIASLVSVAAAVPAYAGFAWGGYTDRNFYGNYAEGLQGVVTPYYGNGVSWNGTDLGLVFVMTAFTSDSYGTSPTYGYQIGLVARNGTTYLNTVIQNPSDSQYTTICTNCYNGVGQHILQLARISNGWNEYVDGNSIQTITGGGLSGAYVYQNWAQEPLVIEVTDYTHVTQSTIDNSFRYSQASFAYEAYPVGSGNWYLPSHGYVYQSKYPYYNCVPASVSVGDYPVPSWVSIESSSPDGWYFIGTTSYLPSPISICSGIW